MYSRGQKRATAQRPHADKRVFVVGVGMSKFHKPKKDAGEGPHYPELAGLAIGRALSDACIDKSEVEQAVVGNMFAGGGAGQRCLYELGIFEIPIHNVSNACATGSNALFLARQFVRSGLNECCLALGVEKMRPGSLGGDGGMDGSPTPMDLHIPVMFGKFPPAKAPAMPQFFGNAGREHMAKYGTTAKHFAMIGAKNHTHSKNNPYAQFQNGATLEEVESARMVYGED